MVIPNVLPWRQQIRHLRLCFKPNKIRRKPRDSVVTWRPLSNRNSACNTQREYITRGEGDRCRDVRPYADCSEQGLKQVDFTQLISSKISKSSYRLTVAVILFFSFYFQNIIFNFLRKEKTVKCNMMVS